ERRIKSKGGEKGPKETATAPTERLYPFGRGAKAAMLEPLEARATYNGALNEGDAASPLPRKWKLTHVETVLGTTEGTAKE
ncbi:hypothetical protein BaRGS_00021712, partial [Batillaria attramentaria]